MNIPSELVALLAWILPLVHLSGLLLALDAIWQQRSAQGATAWAIGLISFPYLGIPLYLILGRSRFRGYILARKSHDARLKSLAERQLQATKAPARLPGADHIGVHAGTPWPALRVLQNLARMPFTMDHQATLLIDGQATFDAIIAAIEKAENFVLVQFYIVRDDDLGLRLSHILMEKAAQGLKVCFLYDEVGSHKTKQAYWDQLRAAGVKAAPFNTRGGGWRNRFQINFRNHRKIVVVDGITAFVGGHNVGNDYLGKGPLGPWRDTHVKVTGPMVAAIQLSFIEDWHWSQGRVLDLKIPSLQDPVEAASNKSLIGLALPTGPVDDVDVCSLMFCQLIQSARQRLWLASPYFVPDAPILTQLKLAALRGVDVRILLPEKADHYLTHLASYASMAAVESFGVKFYYMQTAFSHQKVVLVDDAGASVGTANLDNRSLHLNFEITLLFVGGQFVQEVATMLEADLNKSVLVPMGVLQTKPLPFRLAVKLAQLFAPLL